MSFFRKISGMLLIASLFTLGCVSTACSATEPSITINQSDEVAIYSAVIRQLYIGEITYSGSQPPALYTIRYTDDTYGNPRVKASEPVFISETMQSEITTALQDLPTEIVWVNSSDEVAKDSWGTVSNGGAIIILGNIHLQGDDSVQILGSYYMAGDGGGGRMYILEYIDGNFVVTQAQFIWQS